MIYKPFKELQISTLGMGNMRLPVTSDRSIDEKSAMALIDYAYSHGVNYYDTAYMYHGGESERFIGRALKQYPRESWYLASKMPGHMMGYKNGKLEFNGYMKGSKITSPADIFEEQLQKCGVDYFDFYMLHNLCETAYDFYTDEDLGIVEYLLDQKKKGYIRHLGFSAHGRAETIEKFLEWKDCFEFVQIQLNYLDWILQDAAGKYEVITKHGIPVIVMEPCRGGRLASLGEKANAMLKEVRPNDSIASWAFRFIQSLPNVLTVLSGMTTMEQLEENVRIFSENDSVTEAEKEILKRATDTMMNLVPCTACRYCCDVCPQCLNIPKLISMYNEAAFERSFILNFTLGAMKDSEMPGSCISCEACNKICPQGIDVAEVMKKFSAVLAEMNG